MTKPSNANSEVLAKKIQEEATSLVALLLLLISTGIFLSAIHPSLSTNPFNVNLFLLLAIVLVVHPIANIIDAYASIKSTHPLDAFAFLKRLKWAKEVSAFPNINIARRICYTLVIGLSLNDLVLRYMVVSVGETFTALDTNYYLLTILAGLLIAIDLLSMLSRTGTNNLTPIKVKMLYLLDAVTLTAIGFFAVLNINNEHDKQILVNQGEEREFRTSYPIFMDHKIEDLVYPALMGSKPAATVLLNLVTVKDITENNYQSVTLANILLTNIIKNEQDPTRPPLSILTTEIPNAFSKGDKEALTLFVNGDLDGFRRKTMQIMHDINNNNHSYAAKLYKLTLNINEITGKQRETEMLEVFNFITSSTQK